MVQFNTKLQWLAVNYVTMYYQGLHAPLAPDASQSFPHPMWSKGKRKWMRRNHHETSIWYKNLPLQSPSAHINHLHQTVFSNNFFCFPSPFLSLISLSYLYSISAPLNVHPPLPVDKTGAVMCGVLCVRSCQSVCVCVKLCSWQWTRTKREGCNQDRVRTCSTCSLLSSAL